MIALLDNYDSFTYNLVYLLERLGEEVQVFSPKDCIQSMQEATHIIISPGPKHPKDSKASLCLLQTYALSKPILGVCLGHQCIAEFFGGVVSRGKAPMHGKTSKISFLQTPLFDGLPQGLEVMRYHSLVVTALPNELEAIAWSEDQVIMALRHRSLPIYGVQFHPESILSQGGEKILKNFLMIE